MAVFRENFVNFFSCSATSINGRTGSASLPILDGPAGPRRPAPGRPLRNYGAPKFQGVYSLERGRDEAWAKSGADPYRCSDCTHSSSICYMLSAISYCLQATGVRWPIVNRTLKYAYPSLQR